MHKNQCFANAPAEALRVCRLKVAPATSTCTVRPSRQTGSPSSAWAIEENCSPPASTTVTAPRTFDFERVVGADERRGVLVEADADRERVVGERGHEAAEAVALAEMLVDDEAVGQAEARREADDAGARTRTFLARRDHVLGQDARAGARAADGDAARILPADQRRDGRAAEDRRDAQLVAAREENAAGLFDQAQAVALLGVAARVEIERAHARGAELGKEGLVTRAGVRELARGRDHDDFGLVAAADVDETAQDAGLGRRLFFGAADRDDPSAHAFGGDLAGAHCVFFAPFLSFV